MINSLKASVTSLEKEISAVKEKQRSSDKKIKDLEENAEFVRGQGEDLSSTTQEEKEMRCQKSKMFVKSYNILRLKFDGNPENLVENEQGRRMEDTKGQLVDFLENVLEVENANDIESQRVHRLGKQPRSDSSGRTIIARFLRYSDRERVLRCAYKLKDTDYKIYEDIPKELYDLCKI